jgi:hypothetical protein
MRAISNTIKAGRLPAVKRLLVLVCVPLFVVGCATLGTEPNTPPPTPDDSVNGAPVFKYYRGSDGGYVAVYTHDQEHSAYSVGGDIYVAGLIRVQGSYIGRIFYPTGYGEGDDITHDSAILKLCDRYFPRLKGNDWIGGDTGGFGLE